MCNKIREAKAPFKPQISRGGTFINDADGYVVAAMAAPREDAGGPLSADEMKRWIADNAALFVAAPKLAQFIRAELIGAVRDGVQQAHMMSELKLLAEASNTSVEFEWEQITRAAELGVVSKSIGCSVCGSEAYRMGLSQEPLCDGCFDDYLAEAA